MKKYIIAYCITAFSSENDLANANKSNYDIHHESSNRLEIILHETSVSDANSLIPKRVRLITNLPYSGLC